MEVAASAASFSLSVQRRGGQKIVSPFFFLQLKIDSLLLFLRFHFRFFVRETTRKKEKEENREGRGSELPTSLEGNVPNASFSSI